MERGRAESASPDSEEEREGEIGGDGRVRREREGEARSEEEEAELKRWGPLRRPVQVKIADLGNACWVVSVLASQQHIT